MEQEPIYVPSGKLQDICGEVLSRIYDGRQRAKESYVMGRVDDYNRKVLAANKIRKYVTWLGVKPLMLITPYGMEQRIANELQGLPVSKQAQHPLVTIHEEYSGLEHETKDCLVQCKLNETVPVSAPMVRGISHLGIDLGFMQRPRFGFYPRG